MAIVVAVCVAVGGGLWAGVLGRRPAPASSSRFPQLPATFPGPNGVESRATIMENARPGTTAWIITGPPSMIAGYADQITASSGQIVRLYVSTDAASFQVEAYRMGYYQGTGARLVWTSRPAPGRVQPACSTSAATHMVSCDNWSASLTVPVTASFVPGDYLLKLVGAGGQQSYVPLTVWDPVSYAAYVLKNDVFTWQAWNPYGGYDFYAGPGSCPANVYPLCSRARVVSFDRPYGYGQGAGDFLGNEYPLVRFAEQHGLDVTYAADTTLEQTPRFLLNHRALLSLGHDECWSLAERVAAQNAERKGMNIAFFAASPMLRHVRPQPSPLGPDREEVDYRDSAADPLDGHGDPRQVTGNTWSSPPTNWPETPFVGESYAGYLQTGAPPAPFVPTDPSAWIYRGTGLRPGAVVLGVLGSDFDQFDPGSHPADLQILAHSPVPRSEAETSRAAPYSDTTYYSDPSSGAGVFDSGVNSWIPDLAPCPQPGNCPADSVGQMTGNLLALFGTGPAGHTQPSVPNWQAIYP